MPDLTEKDADGVADNQPTFTPYVDPSPGTDA